MIVTSSRQREKEARREARIATEARLAGRPPRRPRTRNATGYGRNPLGPVKKAGVLGGGCLLGVIWLIGVLASTAASLFVILVFLDLINVINVVSFV
jgi:hypothetical protein